MAAKPEVTQTEVRVSTGRSSNGLVEVAASTPRRTSETAAAFLVDGMAWQAADFTSVGDVHTATSDDDAQASPPTPTSTLGWTSRPAATFPVDGKAWQAEEFTSVGKVDKATSNDGADA